MYKHTRQIGLVWVGIDIVLLSQMLVTAPVPVFISADLI